MKLINDCLAESQKRFLFYNPSDKQKAFHDAGKVAFERLFLAGNRTGKTFCGCLEVAIHLTGEYPSWWNGHRFDYSITAWVASENYAVVRNILQLKLLGGYSSDIGYLNGLIHQDIILKKASLSGLNGALDYLHIKHKSGGVSSLYFKSYEQGRKKFQGARCDLIHLDEECPYDIYEECKIRLSNVDGKGHGRLILTTTPLKGYTELMAYFLEFRSLNKPANDDNTTRTLETFLQQEEIIKTSPEIVVNSKWYIQATWDDNPHLSEETKIQLRATLRPYELEAREKGIPLIGIGKIYQVLENEFLIDPIEIKEHWHCVFGMDVGFFAPTAVTFLAWDKDNDIIYVYKEYSVSERTAAQHASTLFMMGCDWIPGVCDPAVNQGSQRDGARLIDDYAAAGLRLEKASYAKELAVDSVLERIRTGRFKVFSTCVKFMKEWREYSRDEKGKIMKGRDHLMNALEFAILDGLPLAKNKRQHDMKYSLKSHARYF